MCSKLRPATAGTNRFVFSALWVRLQSPLYPARCWPSAALSPMIAVRSPAENVSLAMSPPKSPRTAVRGLWGSSYGQVGGGQFLVRLPLAGADVVGDPPRQVVANPGQPLQPPLLQFGHRALQAHDRLGRPPVGPDAVQVAVRLGQLAGVLLEL